MCMSKDQTIRTVACVSLGCPKNLVDTERMLGLLTEDGIAITPDPRNADAIIINTCGFIQAAKTEALEEIRQAVSLKAEGRCKKVIVAGCLVQRYKTQLLQDVPGIDRLVGVFDREHIVQAVRGTANPGHRQGHYLGRYHDLSRTLADVPEAAVSLPIFENDRGRLRLTPRHYAYLRISEGCSQGCSFCTIPSIRGPLRSKPLEQILAEARELAADGAVELILIGQETTSYGTDIGYKPGLVGLLRELDRQLKDVHWLRLMYAYPRGFTDEMIHAIADCQRVVKYIDLPLQHINDQVLLRMRRRVTRRQIEALLEKLRKIVPGIAIRTTFIAGSPGETDAQHAELVQFVRDFGFDMMGVFAYSQEPGTPMGRDAQQVPERIKQQRVEELMLAQQQVAFAKAKAMVGKTIEVLVDHSEASASGGRWIARGQFQAPEIDSVVHVRGRNLHPGQLLQVKVTGYQNYDLVAELPATRRQPLKVVAC